MPHLSPPPERTQRFGHEMSVAISIECSATFMNSYFINRLKSPTSSFANTTYSPNSTYHNVTNASNTSHNVTNTSHNVTNMSHNVTNMSNVSQNVSNLSHSVSQLNQSIGGPQNNGYYQREDKQYTVQSPTFSSFRPQEDTPKQNYEGFTTR